MTADQFYVDPSVIVGLLLDDFDPSPILSLVADPSTLTYSDFGLGEVIAGMSARARTLRLPNEENASLVAAARGFVALWRAEPTTAADLAKAIELVSRTDLSLEFPDAVHLAIADRLALPLLTNDRQQHRAAQSSSIASRLLQE